MPNTKGNNRRGVVQEPEKSRRCKLQEKSMSYHGRSTIPAPAEFRRPKTLPNLLFPGTSVASETPAPAASTPRLTKLLLNVTIQGSLGAVQVVISPDSTVCDLISAAVRQYVKECRRPFLPSSDASTFDLHYSQFSLESLRREEKLITLGSRNFFLCQKRTAAADGGRIGERTPSCAKEVEKEGKKGFNWLKFMGLLN